MTQMDFQNIRDLGANSNQPLITNQNDFQIFDNVTWIKGRHTLKTGGSLTLRSREILNADNIIGHFQFNNNHDLELRRPAGRLHARRDTGFDVASFLLGPASQKIRNLSSITAPAKSRPTRRSGPSSRCTCRTTGARRAS